MALQWETPKLIVLYREKEENVLCACKVSQGGGTGNGPYGRNSRCYKILFFGCYGNCSQMASS